MKEGRTFETALEAMRNGYKVQRESWKPKSGETNLINRGLILLTNNTTKGLAVIDLDKNLIHTFELNLGQKDILAEDWTVIN